MEPKPWVGCSEVHRRIIETLRRLAPTDLEILITGPTGVGKELYARHAHQLSARSCHPFVAVNCGAIPADLIENELFGHSAGAFTGARAAAGGLVEAAEGGTLFLDEVDALSPRNQVVLLRFLQEKEYRRLGESRLRRADVRIIAASNCDLVACASEGLFRQDLLFRLRVAPISIPPLRGRIEDIDAIFASYAEFYAAHYCAPPVQMTSAALQALRTHSWPGNVRELENCVRYLTCLRLGRPVELGELTFGSPPPINGHAQPNVQNGHPLVATMVTDFRTAKDAVVRDFERTTITRALEDAGGNISQAARTLGKPRRTFFELMRKHNIAARRTR